MIAAIIEVFLIGVSLSMDALAISITNGMTLKNFRCKHALLMGLYFGGFQFLMPLLGAFLAGTVSSYVSAYGHYISFALLAVIGVKMIVDAIKGGDEAGMMKLSHGRLLVMAVATSIDALAVGVSFAFTLEGISLIPACAIIGCTTFTISFLGATLGSKLPGLSGNKAGILGGVVLVAIGIKLLVEGLIK